MKMHEANNPFANVNFGKEIKLFQNDDGTSQLFGPGFFTYNPALKRLSYFKESEGIEPEKEREIRNTIDSLEKELDYMYKNPQKFALEDFDEKRNEIYKWNRELKKAMPGNYRAAYVYFSSDDEIQQWIDLAINARETSAYSIAYETGYRSKHNASEAPLPNTKRSRVIEY